MKFFSTLVILAQLAMFGSLVQATFPTDDILQYSTRELVEELQARMIMAKRTTSGISGAPYNPYRRSVDDMLEFTARGPGGLGPTAASDDPAAVSDPAASDSTTSSTGGGMSGGGMSGGGMSGGGMTSGGGTGSTTSGLSDGSGKKHHGHRQRAKAAIMGKVQQHLPVLAGLIGGKSNSGI